MNSKKLKEMKERGDKLFADIEKLPDYKKESSLFDIEYNVARELYNARKKAKISQAELALKLKTTQSAISRMESGSNVSIAKLYEYAAACGARLKIKIAL